MREMYELTCQFDSRKSFYGKAKVIFTDDKDKITEDLYSYGTLVASVFCDYSKNTETYVCCGKYSQTTTRHQKEFFKQNGLDDKQIKELFKNEKLVINV
jgi:hypothetical protein